MKTACLSESNRKEQQGRGEPERACYPKDVWGLWECTEIAQATEEREWLTRSWQETRELTTKCFSGSGAVLFYMGAVSHKRLLKFELKLIKIT